MADDGAWASQPRSPEFNAGALSSAHIVLTCNRDWGGLHLWPIGKMAFQREITKSSSSVADYSSHGHRVGNIIAREWGWFGRLPRWAKGDIYEDGTGHVSLFCSRWSAAHIPFVPGSGWRTLCLPKKGKEQSKLPESRKCHQTWPTTFKCCLRRFIGREMRFKTNWIGGYSKLAWRRIDRDTQFCD